MRRAGGSWRPDILIKTHGWSNDWDTGSADRILLTHRHLQGVLASYKRVGWAFEIPASYVEEHQKWRVGLLPAYVFLLVTIDSVSMHKELLCVHKNMCVTKAKLFDTFVISAEVCSSGI